MTSIHKVARDLNSKAVVSVDDHGLDEYKKAKSLMREKNKKVKELETRIDKLELLVSKLLEKEINDNFTT